MDAEAKLVITADAGLRGGKVVPLKRMVDEAISLASFQPEHVLVCYRHIESITIAAGFQAANSIPPSITLPRTRMDIFSFLGAQTT